MRGKTGMLRAGSVLAAMAAAVALAAGPAGAAAAARGAAEVQGTAAARETASAAAIHPVPGWAGRLMASAAGTGRARPSTSAQAAAASFTGSVLYGVSCTSATACTATGLSTTSDGSNFKTLAERWNGTAWTVQPTPTPGANGRKGGALDAGVACTSGTACVAAGYSYGTGGDRLLGEGWDGTKWASQAYASPPPAAFPYGMDCAWRKDCMAVGARINGYTLAEHWDGTRWSAETTPHLGGLVGASCPANESCTAVGFNAAQHALAEHWNGKTWSTQSSPSLAQGSSLAGVSCVSASNCVAAGWEGSQDVWHPLAERWAGGKWTVLSAVPNPDPNGGVEFNSVSCTSATSCMAVGDDANGLGTGQATFAAQWNGAAWTVEPTPSPDTFSVLFSVSCTSATACVAVGASSPQTTGAVTPLIEAWDGTAWTVQTAAS
jgi:hypothetical protein